MIWEIPEEFSRMAPDRRKTIDAIRQGARQPIFVIGKNSETVAVSKAMRVDGVIDDFERPGAIWNGIPVISLAETPHGAIIINCSTSISPVSVNRKIAAIPGAAILSYADLCRPNALGLPLPPFVEETRRAVSANQARCASIFNRLEDDESRRVFQRLLSYRLTADPVYMEGFRVALREQYFEPFAAPPKDAVFADCGGYDGDTAEEFAARYPSYRRIYLFEPSLQNLEKAKARLAKTRDVSFMPFGVSNAPATLFFNAEAGSASAISDSGGTAIEVSTLDAAISEPVSFIKMDLEGWEMAALEGGRGHIAQDHPILAIAVYHKPSDFWEIPEYILSIRNDYAIYLRHYTEGWSETVMYFTPG